MAADPTIDPTELRRRIDNGSGFAAELIERVETLIAVNELSLGAQLPPYSEQLLPLIVSAAVVCMKEVWEDAEIVLVREDEYDAICAALEAADIDFDFDNGEVE